MKIDRNTLPDAPWDTDEAAAYLGMSKAYLAKLRSNGGGPRFIKVSSRVHYRRDDIDQWLAAHVYQNTSEVVHSKKQKKREQFYAR